MPWHRWLSIGAKAYAIFACGHVCYKLGRVLRKQLQVRTRAVCGQLREQPRRRRRYMAAAALAFPVACHYAHAACIALRRPYPQSQIRAMEKQTTIPQIHGHPFFGERPLQFAFRAEIIALRLRRSLCPSLLGRTFCFCCCARSSAAAAAPFLALRIDSRFGGELASRA